MSCEEIIWDYSHIPFLITLLSTNLSSHWWFLPAIIITILFAYCDFLFPLFLLHLLIGMPLKQRAGPSRPYSSLFNYLEQCWTHRNLVYSMGYNLMLSFDLIWLLELLWLRLLRTPSSCLSVLSLSLHLFGGTSLLFGIIWCPRFILYFPCLRSGINHFSTEFWFLLLATWCLETRIQVLSANRSRKCMS